MSTTTKTIVLQFFADVVLRSIENVGQVGSDGYAMLAEPVQAILPTDPNRRQELARFRGDLDALAQARSPKYTGYAVPAGTKLVPAVGGNGETVAGNAFFAEVDEASLVSLGEGSSAELREKFVAWAESLA